MEDKRNHRCAEVFNDFEKLELEELDSVAGGGRLSPKTEVLCPKCGELMKARKSWYEGAVGYTKILFVCKCGADKTLTNRDVQ